MIQQGLPSGGILKPRIITLRDYQFDIKGRVRDAFGRGRRKVLMVLPTGGGKTIVFSDIAYDVAERSKYVLVLAHRIELLEQCGNKLYANGLTFGFLNPKYTPDRNAHIQVGTMQTVIKRLKQLGITPDLIIIDEAHRSLSKTYQDICNHFNKALVLGVTATPIRGDGLPLGTFYEEMVVGPSMKYLIERGALVQPIIYGSTEEIDLKGVDTTGNGDFNMKKLDKKMNTPGVTGDAVAHYKSICPHMPAVAFCVSIDHAKNTAEDFNAAGFKFRHIDGSMDGREREYILEQVRLREIDGITSVDLVSEGFDAPILQCGIMLRPTKSEGLYIQQGGRILRTYPGKEFGIILDHANLWMMHEPLTEDREWTLDVEEYKKRKRERLERGVKMKQCPKCYHVHEPAPVCPKCKHVYVVAGRTPAQFDGQLTEITEEMREKMKQAKRQEIGKLRTEEQLIEYGKMKGYKPGWAKAVWRSRNAKLGLV